MNSTITYETAKLLKEKGFDEYCRNAVGINNDIVYISPEFGLQEEEHVNYGVLCNTRMDEFNSDYLTAPTIAEVIMWLYEKHEIWIEIRKHTRNGLRVFSPYIDYTPVNEDRFFNDYDTPREAYLAAIEYTLNNLI